MANLTKSKFDSLHKSNFSICLSTVTSIRFNKDENVPYLFTENLGPYDCHLA